LFVFITNRESEGYEERLRTCLVSFKKGVVKGVDKALLQCC